MRIKILKTNKDAVIPTQARPGDYGYDVTAVSVEQIGDRTYKYDIGLAFEIHRAYDVERISAPTQYFVDGQYAGDTPAVTLNMSTSPLRLAIKAYARSSTFIKHGLILVNSVGIIDEGYRGSVSFIYYHLDESKPIYRAGDVIGQISLEAGLPMDLATAVYLNPTERGEGGYGSTDV